MFGGSCDDVEVLDARAQDYQVDSLVFSKMPMKGHVDGVVARKVPYSPYIHTYSSKILSVHLQVSDYWLRMILPPHPKKLPQVFFADTLLRYHADKQVPSQHSHSPLHMSCSLSTVSVSGVSLGRLYEACRVAECDVGPWMGLR